MFMMANVDDESEPGGSHLSVGDHGNFKDENVLSVYHFEGQDVGVTPEPIAIASASNDRLLTASQEQTIDVHDLKNDRIRYTLFESVEHVSYMIHCPVGDYVATIENSLFNISSKCRVYMNCPESVLQSGLKNNDTKLIMRRRVPGAPVTSATVSPEYRYFDMFEIPVENVKSIATCEITGRLLICRGKQFYLYNMVTCNYKEAPYSSYVDFQLWPHTFDLSFRPIGVCIFNDIISVYKAKCISILKLSKMSKSVSTELDDKFLEDDDIDQETNSQIERSIITADGVISLNKLLDTATDKCTEDYLKKYLHSNSFPIRVKLNPDKNVNNSKSEFTMTPSSHTPLKIKTPVGAEKYEITCLFNLSRPKVSIWEKTKIRVIFKPFYNKIEENFENSTPDVFAIICLVANSETGYLFYVPKNNSKADLIAVYHFNAPLVNVYLDNFLLHALTVKGVDTYNLPTNRCVLEKSGKNFEISDRRIILLNRSSFVGMVNFAITENFMIIFTTPESSKRLKMTFTPATVQYCKWPQWTVYFLKLPDIEKIAGELRSGDYLVNEYPDPKSEQFGLQVEIHSLIHVGLNYKSSSLEIPKNHFIREWYILKNFYFSIVCFKKKFLAAWKCGVRYFLYTNYSLCKYLNEIKIRAKSEILEMLDGLFYLIRLWARNEKNNFAQDETRSSNKIASSVVELISDKNIYKLFLAKLALSEEVIRDLAGYEILSILKEDGDNYLNLEIMLAVCVLRVLRDQIMDDERFIIFNDEQNNEKLINLIIKYKFILFDKMLLILITNKTAKNVRFVLRFLENIFSSEQRPSNMESCYKEAIGLLTHFYIAVLQKSIEIEEYVSDNAEIKYKPIFSKNFPSFLHLLPCSDKTCYTTLCKLQDLIYSGLLNQKGLNELNELPPQYAMNLNVLLHPENSLQLLMDNFPQAIPQYAKDTLKDYGDWEKLIRVLWRKIMELKCEETNAYYQALICCLDHLVHTVNTDVLHTIMSGSIENTHLVYQRFILKSERMKFAHDVKKLIQLTGRNLVIK